MTVTKKHKTNILEVSQPSKMTLNNMSNLVLAHHELDYLVSNQESRIVRLIDECVCLIKRHKHTQKVLPDKDAVIEDLVSSCTDLITEHIPLNNNSPESHKFAWELVKDYLIKNSESFTELPKDFYTRNFVEKNKVYTKTRDGYKYYSVMEKLIDENTDDIQSQPCKLLGLLNAAIATERMNKTNDKLPLTIKLSNVIGKIVESYPGAEFLSEADLEKFKNNAITIILNSGNVGEMLIRLDNQLSKDLTIWKLIKTKIKYFFTTDVVRKKDLKLMKVRGKQRKETAMLLSRLQ